MADHRQATTRRVRRRAPVRSARPSPRLSWIVESDTAGCEQRAYEIVVLDADTGDTDDSGVIESD